MTVSMNRSNVLYDVERLKTLARERAQAIKENGNQRIDSAVAIIKEPSKAIVTKSLQVSIHLACEVAKLKVALVAPAIVAPLANKSIDCVDSSCTGLIEKNVPPMVEKSIDKSADFSKANLEDGLDCSVSLVDYVVDSTSQWLRG